jgi:hypothetical protein
VGDPVVEEGRRWRELFIHDQAEELRVHHRATIAPDEARAVVTALLASGRVPPQQPPLLGIQLPGARPLLERFWGPRPAAASEPLNIRQFTIRLPSCLTPRNALKPSRPVSGISWESPARRSHGRQ